MPRGRLVTSVSGADTQRLRDILENEWRGAEVADGPIIIEELAGTGNYMRLYVVWKHWDEVAPRDRSNIIMRAYQNTHTLEELLNVSIAMGLTEDEAQQMGIRYELE